MKRYVCIIFLVLLAGCNEPEKKVKEIPIETPSDIVSKHKLESNIYFINATSGLNYRATPKGAVLGKFPFNTPVEMVKKTAVHEAIKDDGETIYGAWVGVKNNTDTVYVFSGFLSQEKVVNKDIWTSFPLRKTPTVDSTNFDNVKEDRKLNSKEISLLQLQKIYPNFNKEGYSYRFTPSYQLNISKEFKTLVIAVNSGHELESVLVNYNAKGKIIDFKRVSYDEIAEGWSRTTSTIKRNHITTIDALYTDIPQIDTTYFTIDKLGRIHDVEWKDSKVIEQVDTTIKGHKDSLRLRFHEIAANIYAEHKKKYQNDLIFDNTKQEKPGSYFSLVINNKKEQFTCGKNYEDCTYYKGYIKSLNSYVLSTCGDLVCYTYLIAKDDGKRMVFESPFDNEIHTPVLSINRDKLIAFSSSVYDKSAFISLYRKRTNAKQINLYNYDSFYTEAWNINEIIWIDNNTIALKVYERQKDNELVNVQYLKATIVD